MYNLDKLEKTAKAAADLAVVKTNIDQRNRFSFVMLLFSIVGIVVILVLLILNRMVTKYSAIWVFFNGTGNALPKAEADLPACVYKQIESCCNNVSAGTTTLDAWECTLSIGWHSLSDILPGNPTSRNGAQVIYELLGNYKIMSRTLLCGPLYALSNSNSKVTPNCINNVHVSTDPETIRNWVANCAKFAQPMADGPRKQWVWSGGGYFASTSGTESTFYPGSIHLQDNIPPDFCAALPTADTLQVHYKQALRLANPLYYLYTPQEFIDSNNTSAYLSSTGLKGLWEFFIEQDSNNYKDLIGDIFGTKSPPQCDGAMVTTNTAIGGAATGAGIGAMFPPPGAGALIGGFIGLVVGAGQSLIGNASRGCY